ncbi:SA0570 family protein [Staphylococcus canis]|uniref:Immunodominant antigen B n=1 Tax=Staphylococcus canis TaxID=2724942 RepID=A0ABS0TBI8_9STAP|nr:hypothetical protein [Staphylococcus canis]MBI5975118.1 hypothetical protein [Staphylococcus canis]
MKKLASACLITGMMFFSLNAGVQAYDGNDIEAVEAFQEGARSIEHVTIGNTLHQVEKQYGKGIQSQAAYSNEHYHEYYLPQGVLVVTTNGDQPEAKVTHIAMSYKELDGATYEQVKSTVSRQAIMREHYNRITGNHGYIQDGKVSYQFTSEAPEDQVLKLYRIDIEA